MTLRERLERMAEEWARSGEPSPQSGSAKPYPPSYHLARKEDAAALRAALAAPEEAPAPASPRPEEPGGGLTFDDALRIARGCLDYGGGYRSDDDKLAIYHHGIQTVINSLEAASKRGLADTQVRALHRMGAEPPPRAQPEAPPFQPPSPHCSHTARWLVTVNGQDRIRCDYCHGEWSAVAAPPRGAQGGEGAK